MNKWLYDHCHRKTFAHWLNYCNKMRPVINSWPQLYLLYHKWYIMAYLLPITNFFNNEFLQHFLWFKFITLQMLWEILKKYSFCTTYRLMSISDSNISYTLYCDTPKCQSWCFEKINVFGFHANLLWNYSTDIDWYHFYTILILSTIKLKISCHHMFRGH